MYEKINGASFFAFQAGQTFPGEPETGICFFWVKNSNFRFGYFYEI